MLENKVIDYNEPNLVEKKSISLWVTKDGRCFSEEKDARYFACTHRKCQFCDNLTEKYRLYCRECETSKLFEKFNSYESKDWDGITPLYEIFADVYVWDENDLYNLAEDLGMDEKELSLVFCQKVHQNLINIEDVIDLDNVEEDIDVHTEIILAVNKLNEAIEKYEPLLWEPSKIKAIIKDITNEIH